MHQFAIDVLTNILANIIFWLAGGILVGYLISKRRRKLAKFFGLNFSRNLNVYFSSIVLYENSEEMGLPSYEFQTIPSIASLFSSGKLDFVPDMLAGLVDSFWLPKKPIIQFLPSPNKIEEIEFDNIISIGGPVSNRVTNYYLKIGSPYLSFTRSSDESECRIQIVRGIRTGEVIQGYWSTGILNRFRDMEHGNTVFIVAGGGVQGTRAAVEYLVENWETLQSTYGDKDFGICLQYPYDKKTSLYNFNHIEVLVRLP